MKYTNVSRLERWLGAPKVEELSGLMANWYGPPIALHGVPGAVYITGDGNFIGECRAGFEMSLLDRAYDLKNRVSRAMRICSKEHAARMNIGFTGLSDLLFEATNGAKRQEIFYQKVGVVGVASASNTLWNLGNQPAAGVLPPAAPGGRACVSTTVGAIPFLSMSATGSPTDTLHLVSANSIASAAGMSLLLYDRIFDVAKTMNSNAVDTVTGVPTRYQTNGLSGDSAVAGNFMFVECHTALPNTAHTLNIGYLDETGTSRGVVVTGNNSNIANRFDMPVNQWFVPLNTSGVVGVKAITTMQHNTTVATGTLAVVIGHPLAWIAHPLANQVMVMDYISSSFNLARVHNDACLSLIEPIKSATTATTYNGSFTLVGG
jgi:hypothetical protein